MKQQYMEEALKDRKASSAFQSANNKTSLTKKAFAIGNKPSEIPKPEHEFRPK